MLGWWRRRAERRRARDLEALRERFDCFCHLLEGNNRVLELLADAAEKSGGDHLFDRRYLESLVEELEKAASAVVLDLNAMTGGRHFALVDAFERIRREVRGVLGEESPAASELALPLEHIDLDLAGAVGGKLGTLGELRQRLRLPVPDGFALSAAACRRQFQRCGTDRAIAARSQEIGDRAGGGLERAAAAIQALVRETPLERRVARALRREIRRRGRSGWTYAVRSSAIGENGSHSFAGQHATLLNVPPRGAADAYREVLASLFSSEALRYRHEKGLPVEGALMAVGFLAMVPARASGVIHTVDPAALERDVMVVAAARGLGPTVAHGGASADRFELSRAPPPAVLSRRVATKEVALAPQVGGGTRLVPVPDGRQDEPSLTDEELANLGRMALRIERFAGQHQEIEWAVTTDGRLVILQARALRVHRPSEADAGTAELSRVLAQRKVLMSGQGAIACRGLGAGQVVTARSTDDLRDFPQGGVLVARSASPRFAVVLPMASAVITSLGTSAGHLATVAREFRVPMLVDVGPAVETLRPGLEITVDAEENVVYEGVVQELVRFHLSRPSQETEEEQSRLLRRLLRRIAPLILNNPDSEDFRAQRCRTYHDLIRFAHEMAVRELRDMPSLSAGGRRHFVRRLKLDVPLDLGLVDVGGGVVAGSERTTTVEPEAVQCLPLNAVLRGLTAPGTWRTEPTDMDVGSLLASATRVSDATIADTGTTHSNLAVISRDYLSLHLFLGYHFNMVDCQMAETASYIDFRFHGGATDSARRSRRARLLAMILEEFDFAVETKGDLVIGRFRSPEVGPVSERLEMIGRLIGYSRQLDVLLRDEGTVFERLREFLGQPQAALDRSASGEQAQER